jgi:hypothetical protein
MKKIIAIIFTAIALSANVFAAHIGDTVSYQRNGDRTSSIIRGATGAMTLVETPEGMSCEDGIVIKLDYDLNVLVSGQQKGDIGVCVPHSVFGADFYANLARMGKEEFGAFELEHDGFVNIDGKKCDRVHAMNVKHNYERGSDNTKAKVLWINHQGSIKSVTQLEFSFTAKDGVPVLGAYQIDVKGVSNRGISFKVGLDLQ